MNNFLAFDCGATSGRAVLATFEDGAFRTEEVYRFPFEPDGMSDAQMQELTDVFGLPK